MVNIKKRLILAFSGILAYFILPLVNAQWWGSSWGGGFYNLQQGPQDLISMITNFFSPFLEALLGVSQFDQYFFARVLFLILIYVVVYVVLRNMSLFENRGGINFVVSAIVAILGARYIGEIEFIQAMLLPYGALSMALAIILPFLIFFYFVHKTMQSGAARRAAWIFFGVIFLGLWFTRRTDAALSSVDWIYNLGILAVLLAIIFDAKVHEYFGLSEYRTARRAQIDAQLTELTNRLNTAETALNAAGAHPPAYLVRTVENYRKRIEALHKRTV